MGLGGSGGVRIRAMRTSKVIKSNRGEWPLNQLVAESSGGLIAAFLYRRSGLFLGKYQSGVKHLGGMREMDDCAKVLYEGRLWFVWR